MAWIEKPFQLTSSIGSKEHWKFANVCIQIAKLWLLPRLYDHYQQVQTSFSIYFYKSQLRDQRQDNQAKEFLHLDWLESPYHPAGRAMLEFVSSKQATSQKRIVGVTNRALGFSRGYAADFCSPCITLSFLLWRCNDIEDGVNSVFSKSCTLIFVSTGWCLNEFVPIIYFLSRSPRFARSLETLLEMSINLLLPK